jgi:hypothetical protein
LYATEAGVFPNAPMMAIKIKVWWESAGKRYQETENVTFSTVKAFRQYKITMPAKATGDAATSSSGEITVFIKGIISGESTNPVETTINATGVIVNATTIRVGQTTYSNVIWYRDANNAQQFPEQMMTSLADSKTTPDDATAECEIVFTDTTKSVDVLHADSNGNSTSTIGSILLSMSKVDNAQYDYIINLNYGDTETRAYVYTLVNQWGEEGAPSPADLVTLDRLQQLTVRCTVPVYNGNKPVNRVRLYRSNSATNGVVGYQFVTEAYFYQGWGTLDIVDNIPNEKLGEIMPSDNWEAPPTTLTNLTSMTNGVFAAAVGNVIRFSHPYRPWAWPSEYSITLPYTVVGMMVTGGSLLVTTTGFPYLISGSHPDSYTASRLSISQAGISPYGMADIGQAIIYVSHDGLITVSGAGGSLKESQFFWTRQDWRNYWGDLGALKLAVFDGAILVFGTGSNNFGALIRTDDVAGSLTRFRQYDAFYQEIVGCYVLPDTDQCYVTIGGYIYQFAGGEDDEYSWYSKDFTIPRPTNFGAIQIIFDENAPSGASVYWGVWHGNDFVASGTMNATGIARLPSGFKDRTWSISLSGDAYIKEVHLATTIAELQNV